MHPDVEDGGAVLRKPGGNLLNEAHFAHASEALDDVAILREQFLRLRGASADLYGNNGLFFRRRFPCGARGPP